MPKEKIITEIKNEIIAQKRSADNVPTEFKLKYEHAAGILDGLLKKCGVANEAF